MTGVWTVSDEFDQRLGCGTLAAVLLPLWFGVMALGAAANALAAWVAVTLFAVSIVVALAALRRTRRLPRRVEIDAEGTLRLVSRAGTTATPVAGVTGVELTTSLGVGPLKLDLDDGRSLRLPRHLEDLDGFLGALRRHNPTLTVVDRNPA